LPAFRAKAKNSKAARGFVALKQILATATEITRGNAVTWGRWSPPEPVAALAKGLGPLYLLGLITRNPEIGRFSVPIFTTDKAADAVFGSRDV
jgi:hypothetical protein